MKYSKPLLIVLTPVRNEAWILRAFLSATSLWADYIIIADQMSSDESREIARSYSKVVLIENNRPDIHMGDVRCMLMQEAQKIPGDKILITLDADEFWVGDFIRAEGWKRMLHSQPDEAFEFKWMNLCPGNKRYWIEPVNEYFNWATHVSDSFWEGYYPENRFIHEWRLRWSQKTTKDKSIQIDDPKVAHFCYSNVKRLHNKWRFYAVSSIAIPNKVYNAVSLYRLYNPASFAGKTYSLPNGIFDWYKSKGVDVWNLIDFSDVGQYYEDKIVDYINRDGAKKYAILDIWDRDFCAKYKLADPRNVWQKLLHLYLRATKPFAKMLLVRGVDKMLKKMRICSM